MTSNGILSRAEVMATGAVFTISSTVVGDLIFAAARNNTAIVEFGIIERRALRGQSRQTIDRSVFRQRIAQMRGQQGAQLQALTEDLESLQRYPVSARIGRVLQKLDRLFIAENLFFFRNVVTGFCVVESSLNSMRSLKANLPPRLYPSVRAEFMPGTAGPGWLRRVARPPDAADHDGVATLKVSSRR